MAIQLIGHTTGTIADVETTAKCLRTVVTPIVFKGSYAISYSTNSTSPILATTTTTNLAFRNTTSNIIQLNKVGVSLGYTATTITAGQITFSLIKSQNAYTQDTAGTQIIPSRLRTAFPESSADIVVAAFPATLTAGTRTLSSQSFSNVSAGSVRVDNIGVGPNKEVGSISSLWDASTSYYPIVLESYDGFI